MEIFLDVLILENIVMNYLILMVTKKFSKMETSSFKLFLGSLVGAIYVAVLILVPGVKAYYTAFAKVVLSLLIVAIAFNPKKITDFIKTLVVFYVSTFIFAGAAFAFLYFNQSGGFIRNGIMYFFGRTKWTLLFFSISTVCIIIQVFWETLQHRFVKEKLLVPLKITFESKITDISALIDTGNSLRDPLTNVPVVVVEFNAIKDLLPTEIQKIFEESKENDLTCITSVVSSSEWLSRFRIIPFTALGTENGILIGFKPDYIEVGKEEDRKGIKDVIVGICNKTLSKNDGYKALLSPELV